MVLDRSACALLPWTLAIDLLFSQHEIIERKLNYFLIFLLRAIRKLIFQLRMLDATWHQCLKVLGMYYFNHMFSGCEMLHTWTCWGSVHSAGLSVMPLVFSSALCASVVPDPLGCKESLWWLYQFSSVLAVTCYETSLSSVQNVLLLVTKHVVKIVQ